MTIHGIGVDIVENERVAESIARHGDRFLARVFTDAERAYCGRMKHAARHYAARFAAKEAVAKALGTGIGAELALTDIQIDRGDNGAPRVTLSGEGKRTAERLGVTSVLVSLSHADHYSAASAVAVGGG